MKKEDDKSQQAWFVRHEGLSMGALSDAKIRRLLLDAELSLDDEISVDGRDWRKIDTLPEVIPLQLRAETGDSGAQARLRARRLSDDQVRVEGRRFPVLAVTLLSLVVAGVVGFSLWIGIPSKLDTPKCNAPAAPGVDWRNCRLPGLDVGSASLAGANLNSAILRNAKLSATNLISADLRYADLSGADLRYAQFSSARLMGANLRGADLRGADYSHSDLRFADLSQCLVDSAVFTGANMEGAIWIDGTPCGSGSIGRCLPEKP
jgi:hypothetical protein